MSVADVPARPTAVVPATTTWQEFPRLWRELLDEGWAWMAEKDGTTVGAALTLLDWNQVLAKLNGRLLPFGWLRFLTDKKKITRVPSVTGEGEA